MNKRLNTFIFILCATLFNVLVAVISFILLSIVYARTIVPIIPEGSLQWGFTLVLLSSLAISFLVYRYVLKYLLTKVEIEKYFDPLFVRKYKKKDS